MSETKRPALDVATLTDIGCRRENNEDAHAVRRRDGEPGEWLLVVADGMGGAAGGEVASRIAVDTVCSVFENEPQDDPAGERVSGMVSRANAEIHGETEVNPRLAGMGTTCTAAIIQGDQIVLGHVGDSRAYLVRDGVISQITNDHTLAAEAQRTSVTGRTPSWIPKHLLTRSLGVAPSIMVDVVDDVGPLSQDDVLILCSDGLTNEVEDDEIEAAATDGDTAADICRDLVNLALERGARDNITIVAMRYGGNSK